MSLSSEIFGRDSFIHKVTNIGGLGIPGWLDRKFGTADPAAQMNGIGDIAQQTAKEGDPRTIIWGRVRAIGGNLIYAQTPVKRWIVTEAESGGKGGSKKKQKVYTQHVYRTYAIGVCEGPISKFSRIWKNGSLVYDARGNEWGDKNNAAFLKNVVFYNGSYTQMPSPHLEAIWGVGNVPGHRGTAYMVVINEDLTAMGGAIPQFQFEVERAEGTYLTSRPYSIEIIDESQDKTYSASPAPAITYTEAVQETGGILEAGTLRLPLVDYGDWPSESVQETGGILESGELEGSGLPPVIDNWEPENVDQKSGILQAGLLRVGLTTYTNYEPESVEQTVGEVQSGTFG